MSRRRRVYILTGVPGVGKTTTARMLAELLEGVHIDLSELAQAKGITSGYDEARRTSIVDLDGMRAETVRIIEAGDDALVLEGHFAPDVVPAEAVSLAFVLRRAPWILKDELAARGIAEEKVAENVEAELLDVCLIEAVESLEPERVCEVDTTTKTPQEVVDEVVYIIQGKKPCRHGLVDWLGRAESRGLLGGSKECM